MRRAADVAGFVSDPIGAYVAGRSFVVFCGSPALCGTLHWGTTPREDVKDLQGAMDFIRHPGVAPRFDVVHDTTEVDRVESDILLDLGAFVRERMPEWAGRIQRQAIIVGDGLVGMLVAGLLTSAAPHHALRCVPTTAQAVAFLEQPESAALLAEARERSREHRARPELLDRLRAVLRRDLSSPSIRTVATAMALSPRSLQRELARSGTSFSTQLRAARVAAAVELLTGTSTKIEAVAVEVGLGTASRLSAALRRDLGLTATAIRSQTRG